MYVARLPMKLLLLCGYHKSYKAAKHMVNLSHVVSYSSCLEDMKPFKDHPSTCGWLTSLRNWSLLYKAIV